MSIHYSLNFISKIHNRKISLFYYYFWSIFLLIWFLLPSHNCIGNASNLKKYNQQIETPITHEFSVKSGHPRLIIQPERLDDYQRWLSSSKYNHPNMFYKLLKRKEYAFVYALGHSEKSDAALSKLGISSIDDVGRLAAEQLLAELKKEFKFRFTNARGWGFLIEKLDWFSLKYDWIYHALTQKERQQIVEQIVPKISYDKFYFDWTAKMSGYRQGSGNSPGIITGLAFYEDMSPKQRGTFHQYVSDWLSDLRAVNHRSGNSGGWGTGLSYGIAHGTSYAINLFALETATENGEFVKRFGNSWIKFGVAYAQLMLPSNSWARYGDCSPITLFRPMCKAHWLMPSLRLGADLLRRQGDLANAFLSFWGQLNACGTKNTKIVKKLDYVYPIHILMYGDPDYCVESLKDLGLPLAYPMGWDEEKGDIERFEGKKAGVGVVAMRSAWDDPMATHATFRSMPFKYPVHYNPGELTFGITKGEELALAYTGKYHPHYEGGPYHSQNPGWPHSGHYLKRSVSTNTILVYDPREDFAGWNNDGGQRNWDGVPGIWWYGSCRNGNPLDFGGLTGFEQSPEYVWTSADATRAYNSTLPMSCGPGNKPKVSFVQREFVYLRSKDGWKDYFVIFDRVEAVRPDSKKIWLLHTQARPKFDGTSVVTVGNEMAGIFRSYDSTLATITQNKARLFSKTLLPKKGQFFIRYSGGQASTQLTDELTIEDATMASEKPIDIEVASTDFMPEHPVVIIHHDPPETSKGDTMEKFSTRPWPDVPVPPRVETTRNCYFCEGKTPPGQKPAKLINCRRPPKGNKPPNYQPVGATVIQGFRFMGMEGTDKGNDGERLDYPHAYGSAYWEFRGFDGLLYGMWRIEVEATNKEKFSNFLHVLHPSKPHGEMPPCSLVESDEGNAYGAIIDNKLVLFGKNSSVGWRENPDSITIMKPLERTTYEVAFSGDLWQLIVNLIPNKNYVVKNRSNIVFKGRSSKQGIISFCTTIEGRGLFKLSIS